MIKCILLQKLQALRAIEKYKGTVKADSLQQLHAIHNLEVLMGPAGTPKGIAPTLRDSQLSKDADAIKQVNIHLSLCSVTSMLTVEQNDHGGRQAASKLIMPVQ